MAAHAAFRRQPVPAQHAQQYKAITLPAPTRGIVQHENDAYIGPGAAIVSDNWFPTMKGVRLRGGTTRWCDLHALDAPTWQNSQAYVAMTHSVYDPVGGSFWLCRVNHTSAATGTFTEDHAAHPTYWSNLDFVMDQGRVPVISAFEYVSGNQQRMFAAQETKLFDITAAMPVLVASGRTSGNYSAAQLANLGGYWLIAVNETGDAVLRYNGTSWQSLDLSGVAGWAYSTAYAVGALAKDVASNTYWRNTSAHTSPATGTFAAYRSANPAVWVGTATDGASFINGPVGSPVEFGKGLSYVAKYRNRLFFAGTKTMDVWYLDFDAIGGTLKKIPMSGAASLGGYILFLTNWSIDAGDGIDDKLVVVTSEGEALIWTGSNPEDSENWRQEGRYFVGRPLGMNAHSQVGGDVLILTTEGIVPLSQTITKSAGEMELAMISRAVRRMWREEARSKNIFPWSIRRWDEFGGIFITFPGGTPGNRYCLAMNSATGAFARAVGWDAMCFVKLRGDMFFGTQDGLIMQMERSGYDDANHRKIPYVCTLVGGWEMFQARSQTVVWHQARAVFTSGAAEPFVPQLDAATDFIITIPPPPAPGPDPGLIDVWDQGHWGPDMGGPPPPVPTPSEREDYAQWDQPGLAQPVNRNTMWVSIGKTGFSHAPIVQVTVAQQAKPDVELVAIAATFVQGGVNV